MSEPMTEQQLQEIERVTAAATPGLWESTYTYHGASHCGAVKSNGKVICQTKLFTTGEHESDADFIAGARGYVPALLAEVRRLRAELARRENGCEYACQDEDSGYWECSECGAAWALNDGNPIENNMRFCPECGLRVKAITTRQYNADTDEYDQVRTEYTPLPEAPHE